MEYTTIQVTKETRDSLKELKITNRESYNEIVIRLITQSKNGNNR